jgi:hypothetical protein
MRGVVEVSGAGSKWGSCGVRGDGEGWSRELQRRGREYGNAGENGGLVESRVTESCGKGSWRVVVKGVGEEMEVVEGLL